MNEDRIVPESVFEVKIDGVGKKTSKGIVRHTQSLSQVYLTVFRIIFVCQKPSQDFFSFDIPLFLLYDENVEFPLFGAIYLRGSSLPYQNLLPGNSHFKLWFKNGGCDTFIRILSKLIKENRAFKDNRDAMVQQSQMYNDMRQGKFNFNAYVDPSDPSHIYVAQPHQ